MSSRPLRRRALTLAALAAASVTLLAPTDAAARRFTLPMPSVGDLSAGIVVAKVSVRSGRPRGAPRVRLRLAIAERLLPDNLIVAGRVRRIGRSNRYIARVYAVRSDPARGALRGSAAQRTRGGPRP